MHTTHGNVRSKPTPNDVYVGRAGKGQDGYFGNPVKIGAKCPECGEIHNTGGDTLPCYRQYLWRRMKEPEFRARMLQLEGKRLLCFCYPNPCHAGVLAKAVDWLVAQAT